MSSIYIAGSWDNRDTLRLHAHRLQAYGFKVTSSWLNEGPQPPSMPLLEWRRECATVDMLDLRASDCMVLDANIPSSAGGFHTEFGLAIGYGKPILLILKPSEVPENVFFSLVKDRCASWSEAIPWLQRNLPR